MCSLLLVFQVGAVQLSNAQKRVSLDLQNVTLEDFFTELRRQTGNVYVFNMDDIRSFQDISVKSDNELETDVLDRVLGGLNLGYKIVEDYIVVFKKQAPDEEEKKSVTVRGYVYDEKKQPMPGVTIQVVGTSVGTATTSKGWFSIDLPLLKGKLRFSFVGYESQEVEFTERTDTLKVYMKEEVSDLDEVVVRAYGSQKKRETISAISSVTADEIKEVPAASIATLLQGRLAGVNVIQQSGAPGSASVIAVRGFNSLLVDGASDGQPLWVIDGVPMHSFVSPVTGTNTLADIDPSMIESVTVLKDAAAASIYGSRAGNGVILITTKKGKAGEAKFSANVSYTFSQLMEYPTQTGGRMERWLDILAYRNQVNPSYVYSENIVRRVYASSYEEVYGTNGTYDFFWGNGVNEVETKYNLQDSLDPYYNNSQNWWKYAFRMGKILNANVQASGGSDRFQYMVGLGYYDEKGIMINSGYRRVGLRSNMQAQLTKNLRMDTRIYLSYMDRTMNKGGTTNGRYEGMSVKPDEQYTYVGANDELIDEYLKNIREVKDRTDDYRAMASMFFEYDICKGLTFSLSGNVDYSQGNMNKFTPSSLDYFYHENNSNGAVNRAVTLFSEGLLHYSTSIDEKHNFDVLLGVNVNKEQNFLIEGYGKGSASDKIYYYDYAQNVMVVDRGYGRWESLNGYHSDFSEKVMLSYFARLGYNYKQRYLLEFTLRRDGSSTFGENHRWANFPSVAFGWTFSEEPFIKRWTGSWLNWGKIRGSYGTSGQVFTKAYLAYGLFSTPSYSDQYGTQQFMGHVGVELSQPVAPDLTWEKTEQYDIGLDMDMFNYRLNLKLDYYYKYTSSLISEVGLPGGIYNSSTQYQNAMAVSNEGLELELLADIFREGDFSWRMKLNVARNWNRFEKSNTGKDLATYVIGRPLYGLYVYAYEGFYETEDDVPRYYDVDGDEIFFGGASTNVNGVSGKVGTYKLKDMDGDGYYADQYYAGSPLPLAHGGWINELHWRNFDVNLLFNYSLGRKIINARNIITEGLKFFDYKDMHFWTEPGCVANAPQIGKSMSADVDKNIEKVNNVSLKQLTIGYNLPEKIARKAGFAGVRFFTTCENLFYLSNYSGENPEVIDIYTGVDQLTAYPLPRKWTLGLTLNF